MRQVPWIDRNFDDKNRIFARYTPAMPTADLRKFRKSTLSVEARKAIKSIRSRPKKSRSQQNSRPNYARSTSTLHPPSSTGFRKARKSTPLAWQISSDKSWICKWARTRISPCTSINNKLGGLQRNGQEKHECTRKGLLLIS